MTSESLILSLDGQVQGRIQLPAIFDTPFRPEVIHRAYTNILSHRFQKQGRYPAAGEVVSAESRNTGLGIARVARIRGEGYSRAGQAAGVAGVRHGRSAHPPESWKHIYKKINKKEKRLGLLSAVAATANKELVVARGHRVNNISTFPIIVSNDIEPIIKTQEFVKILTSLGLHDDLARARNSSRTKKRMGRPKKWGISALLVVRDNSAIMRLSNSIPGVDIRAVESLSVLDLVPGSRPIRLTIFTQGALQYFERVMTNHSIRE